MYAMLIAISQAAKISSTFCTLLILLPDSFTPIGKECNNSQGLV